MANSKGVMPSAPLVQGSVTGAETGPEEILRESLKCKGEKLIPHAVEKTMAPHSSTLAWKIPWMEESGRLQSMGSGRVGHD